MKILKIITDKKVTCENCVFFHKKITEDDDTCLLYEMGVIEECPMEVEDENKQNWNKIIEGLLI